MKRYLFINQYVTQLFIDILNVFADRGHEVTLLTGEVIPTGRSLSENVAVVRITPYRRNQTISRITTWLRFTHEAMRYVRNQGAGVELVLSTNPPLLIPLMTRLAGTGQLKYHLIIYDLYPDALSNHWTGKNRWLRNWWRQRNRIVMGQSCSLITIGEKMKGAVIQYLDVKDHGKVQIVPCWADPIKMVAVAKDNNRFMEKHGLHNKFVVLYSGNLGATHDFETLLEASNQLRTHEDINFLIIGDGVKKNRIGRMIRNYNLSNVTRLPLQDPEVLPFSFGVADIGVVSQGEGAELFSVPSKTYYYMAAGAALLGIAGEGSELEEITGHYQNGRVFRPGSVYEIKDFILHLHANTEVLHQYKQNSLHAATHFTPENAKMIYQIIIEA